MKTKNECELDPVYCQIRPDMLETINNYIEIGLPPGGFTQALLANDLMQAMGKADMENRMSMHALCSYIYNETPAGCHGSYERVKDWIDRGGIKGKGAGNESTTST